MEVLKWLMEFRDTADDSTETDETAEIEDVSAKVLEALIESTDVLAVLFCEFSLFNLLFHSFNEFLYRE